MARTRSRRARDDRTECGVRERPEGFETESARRFAREREERKKGDGERKKKRDGLLFATGVPVVYSYIRVDASSMYG